MADHQALFWASWCEELKEASQDEIFAKIHKISFLNTNYGGSPSFVLYRWCEGDSDRRVRTNFRQTTQNIFFKYQLWRITKVCFVLVV
jgi:hypothetical protein